VNAWDAMPVLLLLLLSLAVVFGATIIVLTVRRGRGERARRAVRPRVTAAERSWIYPRPEYWLAVKSRSLEAVQSALGLKCYDYLERCERLSFSQPDTSMSNTERVPLLAARWSIDPARIGGQFLEHGRGISGELYRRF
jgi:hypothetical protein